MEWLVDCSRFGPSGFSNGQVVAVKHGIMNMDVFTIDDIAMAENCVFLLFKCLMYVYLFC